jgi:hypothetical protein
LAWPFEKKFLQIVEVSAYVEFSPAINTPDQCQKKAASMKRLFQSQVLVILPTQFHGQLRAGKGDGRLLIFPEGGAFIIFRFAA